MSRLDEILRMLPDLTVSEMSELSSAVDFARTSALRKIGASGELTADEVEARASGDLMRCVRSIRERTGLGLADAKKYMDRASGRASGDAP